MSNRQHRLVVLVVPVVSLLALTLNIVFFIPLQQKFSAGKAMVIGAVIAFIIVAIIGKCLKPHLGD